MQDFAQNVFKITLRGVEGLDFSDGVKPISIEVFKEWNSETNTGSVLLSESG